MRVYTIYVMFYAMVFVQEIYLVISPFFGLKLIYISKCAINFRKKVPANRPAKKVSHNFFPKDMVVAGETQAQMVVPSTEGMKERERESGREKVAMFC